MGTGGRRAMRGATKNGGLRGAVVFANPWNATRHRSSAAPSSHRIPALGPRSPMALSRRDGVIEEVMPVSRIRLDDLDAIADEAADGTGLAWVPSWLVNERLEDGALVQVLSDRREFRYDAYALWLDTPQLPMRVRLAVDALVTQLSGLLS